MPHKSPGNNALVEPELGLKKKSLQTPSQLPRSVSLNFTMADLFADDVSMDDSFIKVDEQTEEPGLDAHDGQTDAFFN